MKPVVIRNIAIGQGRPKICVPIVASSADGILKAAEGFADLPVDIAEWRVDWYEDAAKTEEVIKLAGCLRQALGDIPLLFTYRTEKEGGERSLPLEQYIELKTAAIKSGAVDLVDLELSTAGERIEPIVQEARRACVRVMMSSHEFFKTPAKEEMAARLQKMYQAGADIPKLAVMPQSKWDVLALLAVTLEMSEALECPIVTMAMSSIGMVSRLAGETFGSALTFGAIGQRSAPGQPGAKELWEVLEVIHKNLE